MRGTNLQRQLASLHFACTADFDDLLWRSSSELERPILRLMFTKGGAPPLRSVRPGEVGCPSAELRSLLGMPCHPGIKRIKECDYSSDTLGTCLGSSEPVGCERCLIELLSL